jgi:hypothetical protein
MLVDEEATCWTSRPSPEQAVVAIVDHHERRTEFPCGTQAGHPFWIEANIQQYGAKLQTNPSREIICTNIYVPFKLTAGPALIAAVSNAKFNCLFSYGLGRFIEQA